MYKKYCFIKILINTIGTYFFSRFNSMENKIILKIFTKVCKILIYLIKVLFLYPCIKMAPVFNNLHEFFTYIYIFMTTY